MQLEIYLDTCLRCDENIRSIQVGNELIDVEATPYRDNNMIAFKIHYCSGLMEAHENTTNTVNTPGAEQHP